MMRAILISAALAVAACGGATRGGVYVTSSTGVVRSDVVPAGTPLAVRLEQPVSSAYTSVGDVITGHTIADLRGYGGELLVPRGSRVFARVVDRQGYGPGAAMWLRVESIEMGGLVQPMRGDVVGARVPGRYAGYGGAAYSDGSVRGELPPGTRLDIRLAQPINSYAALRGRYY